MKYMTYNWEDMKRYMAIEEYRRLKSAIALDKDKRIRDVVFEYNGIDYEITIPLNAKKKIHAKSPVLSEVVDKILLEIQPIINKSMKNVSKERNKSHFQSDSWIQESGEWNES